MNNYRIPENIKRQMVEAVRNAVGDDILEDITVNRLPTNNSFPSRIWDLLNRNLLETLDTQDCFVGKANRGPWEMLVVFEKTTQFVLTFMREKRYSELVKEQNKRNNMHYLDMLTKYFNLELSSPYHQLSLLSHEFSDENKIQEKIQILLSDLRGNAELVRHHALVLFDTVGFDLTSIRLVMLTPALEIALEEDWSEYIYSRESAIVSTVANADDPLNKPNRGLKLKGRAIERQKNKPNRKLSDDQKENQA